MKIDGVAPSMIRQLAKQRKLTASDLTIKSADGGTSTMIGAVSTRGLDFVRSLERRYSDRIAHRSEQ